MACRYGTVEIVDFLRQNGADINLVFGKHEPTSDDMTPIVHAIVEKQYKIADYLLTRGATINFNSEAKRKTHVDRQ
jgi:ankyrin repeat protein